MDIETKIGKEFAGLMMMMIQKMQFGGVSMEPRIKAHCDRQHEVLAPGPIKDLIAHREHRYRISGSSLLAAMDQNSQVPYTDGLSVQPGNLSDDKEQTDGYANHSEKPHDVLDSLMHLTEVKQGRNGTQEVDLKKVAKKLQESAISKKAVIKVSLEELLICSLSK